MVADFLIEHQSVIQHPDRDTRLIFGGFSARGPILPSWGSRERERQLREYYRHDYNTIFRGAISGLVKRVQSTPWEVKAPPRYAEYWQRLFMAADFGDWDRFLSKLIVDYSRHDQGAFVELIAPGDPNTAPMGPVMGIAVLDSVRCSLTGDVEYPVLYLDINGKMHRLHRGRVVQFIDTQDSDESFPNIGECAQARCIAPTYRQILMGRYVETFLDDEPPPGVSVFKHITEQMYEAAYAALEQRRNLDSGNEWGRNMQFYTLEMEHAPTVEHIPHATPPEKFDFERYTSLDVKQFALGIGLDIQDIWELASQGIGTGTQSEVLAQKSRGKAFGRILKGLERVFNRILPEDAEFGWTYKDPQEDLEEAQKAATWFQSVAMATDLSSNERLQILVNQVPAVRDALLDEHGEIRRLPDDDPKPEEDEQIREDTPPTPTEGVGLLEKALSDASIPFANSFASLIRRMQAADATPGVVRAGLRDELNAGGRRAYDIGLIDGGEDPTVADSTTKAARRRKVAEWVAAHADYINKLTDDIVVGLDDDTVLARSQVWANKSLSAIYYAGLAEAAADTYKLWQYDPAKEHCDTCLRLHGQVHTLKDWMKSGYMPQSSALDCGGFNCGCKLVDAEGPAVGRLPRPLGRPGLVDRLLRFVQRIFRRG